MSERVCAGPCESVIPAARLAAMPNARLCVACLTAAGDVPVIKRYDEPTADGGTVEILFIRNRQLEGLLKRSAHIAPPASAYGEEYATDEPDEKRLTHYISRSVSEEIEEITAKQPTEDVDGFESLKNYAIRRVSRGCPHEGDEEMIAYLEPETAVLLGIRPKIAA